VIQRLTSGEGASVADRDALQLGEGRRTMRSFREVVHRNEAHCLEAAVAAAVILSNTAIRHSCSIWRSIDLLDHVIFVFQKNRLWGSIARSRDLGLHGRKPVFRSLRQLVWSYFEPYIDMTGELKAMDLRASTN